MRTNGISASGGHFLGALLLLLAATTPAADLAVDSVAMTVSDLERSIDFYVDVLEFEHVHTRTLDAQTASGLFGVPAEPAMAPRVARLQLGREAIELLHFANAPGRPIPPDMVANDHAFQHVAIIVSDMSRAYARLRDHRVRHASNVPQRLPDSNPQAGGIEAFYFRDPDGHFLELLKFPAGKGEARWHAGDRLFLGIDHTAIVVAEPRVSLGFWRDALGLRVAGESENFGTEQEHLNGVFGAHLLITGLRAGQGPGIEFLHYLAPGNGRAAPTDSAPNDLWHWHVVMRTTDFSATDSALSAGGWHAASPIAVHVSPPPQPARRTRLWRDPDGHAVLVTAP